MRSKLGKICVMTEPALVTAIIGNLTISVLRRIFAGTIGILIK